MIWTKSQFEQLSWQTSKRVAVVALVIAMMLAIVFCGMGFQPGWANGWPFGISKHTVFSLFATTMICLMAGFFSIGVLILVAHVLERVAKRRYLGWLSFVALLSIAILLMATYLPRLYAAILSSIKIEWP